MGRLQKQFDGTLRFYAFAYVKAKLTGQSPSPDGIAESKSVDFRAPPRGPKCTP